MGGNSFTSFPSGADVVGGWVELDRTTLGGIDENINVASLADKRYYMILGSPKSSGNTTSSVTLNADAGTNYATRRSGNGAADSTTTSAANMLTTDATGGNVQTLNVGYLANFSTKEKLLIQHSASAQAVGAATAPSREEFVGKWANTVDAFDEYNLNASGSGTWASGSEVVILGWDPADVHTNNFWEELASVTLGSTGDTLDSGTFTAKKYLWVQAMILNSGAIRPTVQVNSDGGTNYAMRFTDNGGADDTAAGQARYFITQNIESANYFVNMFIVNNSAEEKLFITQVVDAEAAGSGNAPNRAESVNKWVNTSSQIISLQFLNSQAGDFNTGSIIKVWGSD